jgi:hypothetical protein
MAEVFAAEFNSPVFSLEEFEEHLTCITPQVDSLRASLSFSAVAMTREFPFAPGELNYLTGFGMVTFIVDAGLVYQVQASRFQSVVTTAEDEYGCFVTYTRELIEEMAQRLSLTCQVAVPLRLCTFAGAKGTEWYVALPSHNFAGSETGDATVGDGPAQTNAT